MTNHVSYHVIMFQVYDYIIYFQHREQAVWGESVEQEPVHSGGGGLRRASVDQMTWRRRSMWSKVPVMECGADHWKKPLASS